MHCYLLPVLLCYIIHVTSRKTKLTCINLNFPLHTTEAENGEARGQNQRLRIIFLKQVQNCLECSTSFIHLLVNIIVIGKLCGSDLTSPAAIQRICCEIPKAPPALHT